MSLFSKLLNSISSKNKSSAPDNNISNNIKNYSDYLSTTDNSDIPPFQGDYAKAVFLNAYSKASHVMKKTDYQRYLLFECGIRDAAAFHMQLINEGYLVKANIKQILETYNLTELKNVLKEIGQPVSGKKEVLVKRIIDNADESVLKRYSKNNLYALSEKGENFLNNHIDFIRIHKEHNYWNVNYEEYKQYHVEGENFNDTLWRIYNERAIQDKGNFGRNEFYNMFKLLEHEGKRVHALFMLLRILYIDVSGVDNLYLFKYGSVCIDDIDEYFAFIFMTSDLLDKIREYSDVYTEDLVDRVYESALPIMVCPKKYFKEIVKSIIDDEFDKEQVKTELKRYFIDYIENIKTV